MTAAGRFAPTPSADLHIGNLRTALLAWLFARSSGRRFVIRVEDLDPDRCDPQTARRQLDDLEALGLDWDGPVEWQSLNAQRYAEAIARLESADLAYPCFCTRAERAAEAPHGQQPRYSGRCRNLSPDDRVRLASEGRVPSLRARVGDADVEWTDLVLGTCSGLSEDPIVRRADGVFAYNLAVVVDDSAASVDQVVRGDDLSLSVPTQAALCDALGLPRPTWGHVPLVVDSGGERLAKRGGGVTLAERSAEGQSPGRVLSMLGASLGLCSATDPVTPADLLSRFDPEDLPSEPWELPSL